MSGPSSQTPARVDLSIVMPVFNTGPLLRDAVASVVSQTAFAVGSKDSWELIIVDDASTDPATCALLDEVKALSPSIRVLPNARGKGAAGSRNTGLFAARGAWIGFLDSDDVWYPDFIERQREAFAALPAARWRAAHFDVGDEDARVNPSPLQSRSPCLYGVIGRDHALGKVSMLRQPVDVLLRCGCMQVMTVQVRRELLVALGGFDEDLVCAEDYDLWIRLARTEDLYMAPLDAGIYRNRAGSLTKSGRPMYFGEDRMLEAAKADPGFARFRPEIDARLVKVYTKFCFHFRECGRFADAIRFAWKLIRLAPGRPDGWRQWMAALLRR